MKYLDTYETWSKIFKLAGYDDEYAMYIHDNKYQSLNMDVIYCNKKELLGLAEFILSFFEDSNDIS